MPQDNSSCWTDIKTLEEILAASPGSFCFARLSELYLKVGLIDDALHTARQGNAKYPAYLAGQRALAFACHAKGLTDDCLAALKLLTAATPEDRESMLLLARLTADAGDYPAARQILQTVLEFFPDDPECHNELQSLELFDQSAPSLPYAAEQCEEEILDDLEIIEELEVVEDNLPGMAIEDEETAADEPPLTGFPPAPGHDPLSTGTLAELYVSQGFIDKALNIYRSILLDTPDNRSVATRIAELEQLVTADAGFAPADNEPSGFSFEEETEPDPAESVSTLDNVCSGIPEPVNLPLPPAAEKPLFAEPDRELVALVQPQGSADNALSVLEGWLENVRRIKSCR